jgi:hypothetical protein
MVRDKKIFVCCQDEEGKVRKEKTKTPFVRSALTFLSVCVCY